MAFTEAAPSLESWEASLEGVHIKLCFLKLFIFKSVFFTRTATAKKRFAQGLSDAK